MKAFKHFRLWIILILLTGGYNLCFAMTADQLKDLLEGNTPLTIIDARSSTDFQNGHIRNAVNIPCSILKNKKMPPVGKTVVYGDGLNKEGILAAADALNRQKGIEAEVLEGGYPVWAGQNDYQSPTFGISKHIFPSISYQDLKAADSASDPDLVLVDLRRAVRPGKHAAASDSEDLSDLKTVFPSLKRIQPNVRLVPGKSTNSVEKISGLSNISDKTGKVLYVLIDRGDGTSQKVARHLKAKGILRTAILIGGEKIIRSKGEASVVTETTRL